MDNINIGDILLNIDQVSKLTGVKKSTIRYWEKSFEQFLKRFIRLKRPFNFFS
jgi:hypothetical protein